MEELVIEMLFNHADTRIGSCYLDVPLFSTGRSGVCNDKIAEDVSRASCCCTVGRGWGEVIGFCDPCPQNGTGTLSLECGLERFRLIKYTF